MAWKEQKFRYGQWLKLKGQLEPLIFCWSSDISADSSRCVHLGPAQIVTVPNKLLKPFSLKDHIKLRDFIKKIGKDQMIIRYW